MTEAKVACKIAMIPHTQRPQAVALAEEAATWLRRLGHEVRLILLYDSPSRRGPTTPDLGGVDLAVSLGGGGTMLRTVDLVGAAGVPVLGVNLGHLGYLTVVEPPGLEHALKRFLAGDFDIERRMTLQVDTVDADGTALSAPLHALNDVVLQRVASGHTARLALSVSEVPFLEYDADSVIVATPTGSTAYNLSARGPIVSPRARVLVVTPVAVHMLFDRSLVLADDESVVLEVLERDAELVVDGTTAGLVNTGGRIRCRIGGYDAQLVQFGERDFRSVLKSKFGLLDRER